MGSLQWSVVNSHVHRCLQRLLEARKNGSCDSPLLLLPPSNPILLLSLPGGAARSLVLFVAVVVIAVIVVLMENLSFSSLCMINDFSLWRFLSDHVPHKYTHTHPQSGAQWLGAWRMLSSSTVEFNIYNHAFASFIVECHMVCSISLCLEFRSLICNIRTTYYCYFNVVNYRSHRNTEYRLYIECDYGFSSFFIFL